MTKKELLNAEDKLYDAVRKVYGYGEQADELVDILGECVDLALDTAED